LLTSAFVGVSFFGFMANTKILNRVKLPLVAKTRLELVKKQVEINRARDKEFDFSDPTPIYSNGEVVEYECWYYDTLEAGQRMVV
jgi:hypothetical protein